MWHFWHFFCTRSCLLWISAVSLFSFLFMIILFFSVASLLSIKFHWHQFSTLLANFSRKFRHSWPFLSWYTFECCLNVTTCYQFFRVFISSWFGFGNSVLSRNLSMSYRSSSLLKPMFLKHFSMIFHRLYLELPWHSFSFLLSLTKGLLRLFSFSKKNYLLILHVFII